MLLQIATLLYVTPYEPSPDVLGPPEIQEVGAAQAKSQLMAGDDSAENRPELFAHWQMESCLRLDDGSRMSRRGFMSGSERARG